MKTTDEIMAQAQVFASAWALVGSRFDDGYELDNANEQKAALRSLVEALAKDVARLDWLVEHRAYVTSNSTCCDGFWLHFVQKDGRTWVQATEHVTPREAIDKAIEAAQAEQT